MRRIRWHGKAPAVRHRNKRWLGHPRAIGPAMGDERQGLLEGGKQIHPRAGAAQSPPGQPRPTGAATNLAQTQTNGLTNRWKLVAR